MTSGGIDTSAVGMEENQKQPQMVIKPDNWYDVVGGIEQKDVTYGRIDFTEKTYNDICFNAVLRVKKGDGAVGVGFRRSADSINSGYVLRLNANRDLVLNVGENEIVAVKLTEAQAENGNVIIETYGSRILVYIMSTE